MEIIGLIIVLGVIAIGFWLSFKMNNIPEWKYEKMQQKLGEGVFFFVMLTMLIFIICVVGLLWYILCGGWFIFNACDDFGDVIMWVVISIIASVYVFGILAHFFK